METRTPSSLTPRTSIDPIKHSIIVAEDVGSWDMAPSNSANYGANKERGGNRTEGEGEELLKTPSWKGGPLLSPVPQPPREKKREGWKGTETVVAPTATPSCHLERPKAERRRGGEVVAARKSRRRRRRLIPNNSRAHLDEAPSTENRPSKCSYFTGGGNGYGSGLGGGCSRCSVQMLQIIETKQSLLYKVCRHSLFLFLLRSVDPFSLLGHWVEG